MIFRGRPARKAGFLRFRSSASFRHAPLRFSKVKVFGTALPELQHIQAGRKQEKKNAAFFSQSFDALWRA
jgi:hypothetical protein